MEVFNSFLRNVVKGSDTQHMLQDFKIVSDRFTTLRSKGLRLF